MLSVIREAIASHKVLTFFRIFLFLSLFVNVPRARSRRVHRVTPFITARIRAGIRRASFCFLQRDKQLETELANLSNLLALGRANPPSFHNFYLATNPSVETSNSTSSSRNFSRFASFVRER